MLPLSIKIACWENGNEGTEIISWLFILHIRTFDLRVFICLESHTVSVAGADNILGLKGWSE